MNEQWVITAIGLLVTIGINLFLSGRWVGSSAAEMKIHVSEKIKDAVREREAVLERLRRDWADSQKSQDNVFGELGASLRQALADLKDDMHNKEMWGRDNYVHKSEVALMREDVKGLRSDLQTMINEIKQDFKDSLREVKKESSGRGA
jgi:hypothetical protein